MQSPSEFTEAFLLFIGRVSGVGDKSPKLYNNEMSTLNTLLINIEDEPLTGVGKCKPLLIDCIDKFLQIIIQQEHVDDRLSWFAINLYLSKFIRLVIYPEIQMIWPILLRITVFTHDFRVLHKVIECSLCENPVVSWISSKILLNMIQVDSLFWLVKESLNTKENIKKFRNLLWLNSGITTLMNLISLFVHLELELEFIPNLVTPYIRYIHSVNPKFSDFIPCSVILKNQIINKQARFYLQPINHSLLILWHQLKEDQTETYYINLVTLSSFRALPNCVLKLNFQCSNERQLRSEAMLIYKYMKKFSIKIGDLDILDTCLEITLKHNTHYNWLVKFFKVISPRRKISVNSKIQVPLSQKESLDPNCSQNDSNNMMVVAAKRRKVSRSEPWDFFDISEMSRARKNRKYEVSRDMHKQSNVTKICLDSEQIGDGRNSKNLLFVQEESDDIEESSFSSQNNANPKEYNNGNCDQFDLDTATGETTKDENQNVTCSVVKPLNRELDITPICQDNATPTSDYNYINESLILFSSNIVNKLKTIEYNVLQKRNELQNELDLEFARIFAKHKQKLHEIQQHITGELNKLK